MLPISMAATNSFELFANQKTEVLHVRKQNKTWTWMLWLDTNHVIFGRTSECFLLEYQCLYDDRWSWMCDLMFTCRLTYSTQVCRMCLTVLYSGFLLEWDCVETNTWLWFIKAVGNAMSVFIFPYFGARSSCDWVMAFLPDICRSVVVNMNIILKLSMCLC